MRTKTVIESSNVVINDELCSESRLEDIPPVQEKTIEVDDSLPEDYVGTHSDEDLQFLNDAVLEPSSSEPSTPVRETQQEQSDLVLHLNKKVPLRLWSKVHLLE